MRRGTWVLIAGAALVLSSPFLLTAPLPSGGIGEARDRFEPQGYESVRDGHSEPRRLFCLGDNACPSVSRHWVFDAPFLTTELQTWLDDAGYSATVDGDCSTGHCDVFGSSAGWTVLVLVAERSPTSDQVELSLYLRNK